MKDASQYPVTQGYGYDPNYPLNGGNHRGIDYGCPVGTPVVVNGVTIGLSGKTGAVTGPHLHVGRFVNGQATNPGNGGFTLTNAVVDSVGYDSVNGNYIRVNGSGAVWVYLHLSKINVTKGQVLKGGIMEEGKVYELLNERDKRMDSIQDTQAKIVVKQDEIAKNLDNLYTIVDKLQKSFTDIVKPGGRLDTDYQNLLNAINKK